jgi:phosphate transport system substrate-binding protein
MRLLRSLPLLLATALLSGCTGGSAADGDGNQRQTIRLAGSSTLAPLAIEIGKRFEERNPGVRIEVQTGGSSRGIADARTGAVECGMSSRDLKDSEKEGVRAWTVAMDGVCFLVHAANPVRELSEEQLRGIYTGRITRWSEVGGRDAEIICINRADGRSELELVTKHFGIDPREIDADLIAGENQQGIKMVASDENAITYMSVGASEDEARNGTPIHRLPLRGVEASVATVAGGTYPLSRPLIYVTSDEVAELVSRFIEYSRSAEVDDLVKAFSYVPLPR